MIKPLTSVSLALVLLGMLAACTSSPSRSVETGQGVSLEQRVNERWDALASKNFRIAYRYLSPGYRGIVSVEAYEVRMFQKTVDWLTGKYTGEQCESDQLCEAAVYVEFEVDMHVPGVGKQTSFQSLKENWIQIDEIWYFVPPS